jgi:hypothetical protein
MLSADKIYVDDKFPFSGQRLTRAQLIGGVLATGALAACGRGTNPATATTSAGLCTPTSLSAADLNQIFSDPVFAGLDKALLTQLYNTAPQIKGNDTGYFTRTGQQLQSANVITSIPPAGIVIRTPGTYTFAGDISWTPAANFSAAITIACSNVTVNLAGWTLSASVADKRWQTAGILVGTSTPATLENITISSGTIANPTEYGIFATGVCGLDVSHVDVTGVCLHNLNIRYLAPSGIFVTESLNVVIAHCNVLQMLVKTDSCAGIFVQETAGASVSNCSTTGLQNLDGAVQGFSCIGCVDVATSNCTALNLQSFFNGNILASGHTVLGFCPIICASMSYTDCSATNLTGSCDDVHGISVFLDGDVLVTGFQADTIVDGPPPYNTGAKATGVEVYGVLVTIKDSTANNIIANNPQDLQATGFSACGKTIGFDGCTASNVQVNGPGNGTGFGWAPDPRPKFLYPAIGVAYTNCIADTCAVGFDTFNHQNSIWTGNIATNCAIPILIQPGAQRTLTCDGCSECPPGGQLNPAGYWPATQTYYEVVTNVAGGNLIVP